MPKLDLLGIVTKDMPRSLAFYRLLGVSTPEHGKNEQHIETTLPNGLRLAWDSLSLIQQLHPNWEKPTGHPIALAFLCESPADVDALYQHILDAGFEGRTPPWDAFWGQRYAVVNDPDGNQVDLFAPLP